MLIPLYFNKLLSTFSNPLEYPVQVSTTGFAS